MACQPATAAALTRPNPDRGLPMAVHIRLSRAGTKKAPFYRIVVADQRCPRGGRFIERIGTFDPLHGGGKLEVNRARVSHWLQLGAVASRTVTQLLGRKTAE